MVFVFGRYGVSVFRQHQNKYLREYGARLTPRTVLNLGAKPGEPDKEGGVYEDYFPEAEFYTLDLGPSDAPNHFQADLMAMPDIGEFDLVLAMSTIEHIDRPWLAARNISKLVRPGGHLYITMPYFYPVHEGPYYGDHWRASPSAMQFLFDDMIEVNTDLYPSVVLLVKDRPMYWGQKDSSYVGFSMLLRRSGDAV